MVGGLRLYDPNGSKMLKFAGLDISDEARPCVTLARVATGLARCFCIRIATVMQTLHGI